MAIYIWKEEIESSATIEEINKQHVFRTWSFQDEVVPTLVVDGNGGTSRDTESEFVDLSLGYRGHGSTNVS